ncbi:coiled-coil domain-containing protein 162-like isoform 1-T1 [Odontesthes bonariensis]|uniref:coiled-coil domain-containing protein 162-like isoform X1 n=2 Tax=Odontesthes bonariensis TaxID=219752 RepID=UPI003F5818B7
MESTECDMIRAVQRRISREMTLVVSERTRKNVKLPIALWKKTSLKYSLSPERSQMMDTFIQQLMKRADQSEGRDLKSLHNTQKSNPYKEVAEICDGMMLEISGLQARVAQLGEEKRTLEEQLSLKFRERYDPLVRHLFSVCIQLKALSRWRRVVEQEKLQKRLIRAQQVSCRRPGDTFGCQIHIPSGRKQTVAEGTESLFVISISVAFSHYVTDILLKAHM